MLTSGDNRYLVATWGRAGSSTLCQYFYSHIKQTNNKAKWQFFNYTDFDPLFNQKNNIVGHCHSLEQIQFSSNFSNTFVCIRSPSYAAISWLMTQKTNYHHVYNKQYLEYVKLLENKTNHHRYVLNSLQQHEQQQPFILEVDYLNHLRSGCINWNNIAFDILKNVRYSLFNYDVWQININKFVDSLNYLYDIDDIAIVKNPKRWEDYTINKEEVMNWISSNKDIDTLKMEQWQCPIT